MRRSDYDHVPNRIKPPHVSIDERRGDYESISRSNIAALGRQPLLGDFPDDPYRQTYQAVAYNGPVPDITRRRGFDKGPYGEDLTMGRCEGRQPLLTNPKLAVEHIGGDMDISRSRSASPGVCINARSVRDDRKKERHRLKRSRSRSRSRERNRGKYRDTKLIERDSGRGERSIERHKYLSSMPSGQIRDGIVWTNDNYYEFLIFYIKTLNEKIKDSVDRDAKMQKKLNEEITAATDSEKERIVLPPDFNRSDRERMLHCDTTITGLPASIFFGSGYGSREHYAKYSAAKDLIDKCHRIGVINSELHAAIGDRKILDRAFKSKFNVQISKAVNAVILLMKKMKEEQLPHGFMSLRHLQPDLIDRFKTILRMVMIDVYYQGMDANSSLIPKTLETGYSSHSPPNPYHRDANTREQRDMYQSQQGNISHSGPSADELLRAKELELIKQMERELEKKRHEMEQEIRQKVLEEERAKIRAEIEMEKKLEIIKMEQQKYQVEKEKKEIEEQQRNTILSKEVEGEFNALVGQLEQRFIEVRSKGLTRILDTIYESGTFKSIKVYSSTLTSLSLEQKQELVRDLRSLLDTISIGVSSAALQNVGIIGSNLQQPLISSYSTSSLASSFPFNVYQMAQISNVQQQPQQVLSSAHSLSSSSMSSGSEVRRLTLGNMQLRSLSQTEQILLQKGSKVIAQDAKTGNWSLASVVKIRDNRVTLAVGNATWKKYFEELYKEDDRSPIY